MASSLSAILVSSALISVASASCRGVQNIQKVDVSKLKGVWFESHSFGLLPVAGPRLCHAVHIYPADDRNAFTVLNEYVNYVGDQAQSRRFGWNVTDEEPVKDGRFTVDMALHFSGWIKATLVVMDTDYSNYVIIYVCRLADKEFKFNAGLILTRRKLVDDEDDIHLKIANSFKRNLMTKSGFIRTPQKDCKDVSFPDVFPSSIPIGKPATMESIQVNAVKPAERPAANVKPQVPVSTPVPSVHQASPSALLRPTNIQVPGHSTTTPGVQGDSSPLHRVSEWARLNTPTNPDRLLSQIIYRLEMKAGFFKVGGSGVSSSGSSAPPNGSGLQSSGSSAPPNGSGLPSSGSGLQSSGSGLPSSGSGLPSSGSSAPSGGSGASSSGSSASFHGSGLPSSGSGLQSSGSGLPSSGSALPSSGSSAPSGGSGASSSGSSASFHGSGLPSSGSGLQSSGSGLPSSGSGLPSIGSVAPPAAIIGKPPVQSSFQGTNQQSTSYQSTDTNMFLGRPFSNIIAALEAHAGLNGLFGKPKPSPSLPRPPPSSQQIPTVPSPSSQPNPVAYSNPIGRLNGDRLLGKMTSRLITRASFPE